MNPPPTPCSSTLCPLRMRPSRTATSSASGIDAAEVLAWRSTVTMHLDSGSPSFVRRFATAAGNACLAEATMVSQWSGQWAEFSRQVYDFRKVRRVRYLAGTVEAKGGAAAAAKDPAVGQIALEGPDWICRETTALDPARSGGQRACEGQAVVDAAAPERKSVIFAALEIIRKACRLPK